MKVADIEIGGEYAVTGVAKEDWHRTPYSHRSLDGTRCRVLGFEKKDTGRTLVRVEITESRPRCPEWEEDNGDGTITRWNGIVLDENGNAVEDETTVEAVIQPVQVKFEWTEAIVRAEMRSVERVLNSPRREEILDPRAHRRGGTDDGT